MIAWRNGVSSSCRSGGILVFLAYRMRRVDCKRCGVTVEMVPWCDGKNQLTMTYRWYLATWAKRLSWTEVGSIFGTSWDSVCRAVEHAVEWGLAHRDLSKLTALGIDEVAWAKGHTYLTLVYDISGKTKRLLAVAEERTKESLRTCLAELGTTACQEVKYVCSDMWKPYLNVIAEKLGQAVHILDRFHAMQQFGKALDEIRAEESKQCVLAAAVQKLNLLAEGPGRRTTRLRWILVGGGQCGPRS